MDDELASAYWAYEALQDGDRNSRLLAESQRSAWDQIHDVIQAADLRSVQLLDVLLRHPESDVAAVGAGFLEDLLYLLDTGKQRDRETLDALAQLATAEPRWQEALRFSDLSRLSPSVSDLLRRGGT